MKTTITPKHTHNCDVCKFIGCSGNSDLYVCDGTLVVRHGSEPLNDCTLSGYVIDALIKRGDSVEGFLDKHYADEPAVKACYLIAKMNGLVN